MTSGPEDPKPKNHFTAQPDKEPTEEANITIEKALEVVLSTAVEKKNEGNNGIIYLINTEKVPEKYKKYIAFLKEKGILNGEDRAIKLIKIYFPGKGKEEFDRQKRAYEILQESPEEQSKLAKIPTPIHYSEISLSQEMVGRIKLDRVIVGEDNKVELLVMDAVPGEDLATILYKIVILSHQGILPEVKEAIDTLSFDDLQREVERVLRFRIPGGKARDEKEQEWERMEVFKQNAKTLFRYVRQQGRFKLDPRILEKVKNTLKWLHEKGFYHRDLHERNIMLSGNYNLGTVKVSTDDSEPQVYIVDFGAAREFEGNYDDSETKEEIYKSSGGERRYIIDEYIVRILEMLTTTIKEEYQLRRAQESQELLEELKGLLEKTAESGTNLNAKYQRAKEKLTTTTLTKDKNLSYKRALDTIFYEYGAANQEYKVKIFIVLMLNMVKDKLISAEEAKQFLQEKKEEALTPALRNFYDKVIPVVGQIVEQFEDR